MCEICNMNTGKFMKKEQHFNLICITVASSDSPIVRINLRKSIIGITQHTDKTTPAVSFTAGVVHFSLQTMVLKDICLQNQEEELRLSYPCFQGAKQ